MADGINDVFASAPELVNSPGLAVAAAQSPDPAQAGQILSHADFMAAIQHAQQTERQATNHGSWLNDLSANIGDALSPVAQWANKPLQEVQKDYRFVHYVYANHGLVAGTAAALGIAGAGVAGSLLGPGGTAAGVTLAGTIERDLIGRTFDRQDYNISGQSNTGVSAGRDLAHGLGLGSTDSGLGKLVSGAADAAFDVGLDPLVQAGKLNVYRKNGELGRFGSGRLAHLVLPNADSTSWAPLIQKSQAAQDFLSRVAPGMKISSPDQVAAAVNAYSPVRRALQDIASTVHNLTPTQAAGNLTDRFPAQAGLIQDLVKAKGATPDHTFDNVVDTFRRAAFDGEMAARMTSGTLPSRSLIRVPFAKLTEKARTAGGDSTLRGVQLTGVDSGQKMTYAQRAIKTFTGYQGTAINRTTGELSAKEFDLMDPQSLPGILNSFTQAWSRTIAREYTGRIALAQQQGNLSAAKSIWAEAQNDLIKAANVPDAAAPYIFGEAKQAAFGAAEADPHVYGFGDELGAEVGRAPRYDRDGNLIGSEPAALTEDQTASMMAFPRYDRLREVMRNVGADQDFWQQHGLQYVGNLDDQIARRFTNSYFKPMALLSMGFGARIALAEAIPGAIRHGAMNMLRGAVSSVSAKNDYDLQAKREASAAWRAANPDSPYPDEKHLILSAAARAVGGVNNLINNPENRDFAIRMVQEQQGHIVWGPAAMGQNDAILPAEQAGRTGLRMDFVAKRNAKARGTYDQYEIDRNKAKIANFLDGKPQPIETADGRFKVVTPDQTNFRDSWIDQLQRKSQQVPYQKMTQDMLNLRAEGLSDQDVKAEMVRREAERLNHDPAYTRESKKISSYTSGEAPESFAFRRVDDLHNLVKGANSDGSSVFHEPLAQMLASGTKPTMRDIKGLALPKGIIAPVTVPYVGPKAAQRAFSWGFAKAVDPIASHLSREPLWFNQLKEEYDALKPAIDAGWIDDKSAFQMAQRRAATEILPQIHNLLFRSQFSDLARNALPFYFAQEQAIKRYGKLTTINPAALREFELMEHGLNDPGFVQTDDNGNRFITIPTSNAIGKLVTGAMAHLGMPMVTNIPLAQTGNLISLNTVLPHGQLPQVGPLVSISANLIASKFPELAPAVQGTVGQRSFGSSITDNLIPNTTLRSIVKAYQASQDDSAFHNAYLTTLAEMYYHGDMPPANATYHQMQEFNAKVKNVTRSKFYLKALLASVSPLSPSPQQGDLDKRANETLTTEFYQLLRPKSEGGAGLTINAAMQTFAHEYGEKALVYTVAKSDSTSGANIPNTNEALQYIQNNRALLDDPKYNQAAAFLVPQAVTTDGNTQLVHNELVAMGMRQARTPQQFQDAIYYSQGNQQYFNEAAVHKANLAADPSKAGQAAENQRWADVQAQLKLANPVWADQFTSQEKTVNAARMVAGLQQLFLDGRAPAGAQTSAVAALLADYQKHQAYQASIAGPARLAHQRKVESDQWSAYLDSLEQSQPVLQNVIQTIFKPLTYSESTALANAAQTLVQQPNLQSA